MTAPPNPNKADRRAIGLLRQAAQQIKDDAALGAKVRELLAQHMAERAAVVAEASLNLPKKNERAVVSLVDLAIAEVAKQIESQSGPVWAAISSRTKD